MIKKAIIPVAGRGTRMLRVTNGKSKEMLPVGGRPALSWIVEEAVLAGIEEILLVTSRDKKEIPLYFSNVEEPKTYDQGYTYPYDCRGKRVQIGYLYQERALGSGNAVSCGEEFAAGEAVAVLFGDDVMVSDVPVTAQLHEVYLRNRVAVVGVQTMPEEVVRSCASVIPSDGEWVSAIVEKPTGELTSHLASLGRFVASPEVFVALREQETRNGEIWLTDALNILAKKGKVCYCNFEGIRYDVGSPDGYQRAISELNSHGYDS